MTNQIRRLAPNVFDQQLPDRRVDQGLANATSASGRPYLFYWWEDRPTSHAIKPGVAAARERIGR